MQGQPPDWQDFVGIVALLIINSTISFIEENNAGNAAAALMASLALKTKVLLLSQKHKATITLPLYSRDVFESLLFSKPLWGRF